MDYLSYDSFSGPWGELYVIMGAKGLRKIMLTEYHWDQFKLTHKLLQRDPIKCRQVTTQLQEYLNGQRKQFSIPLELEGSEFSKKVWTLTRTIPFGRTTTYSNIALSLGNPKATRAVGQANRCNPIPIIIPCHRVIAKNGNISGYLGNNITIKEYLLELENKKAKQVI